MVIKGRERSRYEDTLTMLREAYPSLPESGIEAGFRLLKCASTEEDRAAVLELMDGCAAVQAAAKLAPKEEE
jgi:hypothetical protein